MTKSESKETVWERLIVAQQSIQAVGKGSQNQYHGYSYTSAEDMLKASRAALHSAGLVAIRKAWRIKECTSGAMVESHFMIFAPGASNGQDSIEAKVVYPAIPGNGRPLDKAVSSALTTCFSYWLRDLLLLPRVDGLEVDTRDDSKYDHEDHEAKGLAIEIEDRASPEQVEKLSTEFKKYGATKFEEVPVVTLRAWLKRVKELNSAK